MADVGKPAGQCPRRALVAVCQLHVQIVRFCLVVYFENSVGPSNSEAPSFDGHIHAVCKVALVISGDLTYTYAEINNESII